MAGLDKNLQHLQEHLDAGETVEAAVLGTYETKKLGNDWTRNGIFAATNRRVVFFAKKLGGYDLESFPYENISSFESGKGMMGHTLTFHASGNSGRMKWIQQADAIGRLVEIVRGRMGKGVSASAVGATPPPPPPVTHPSAPADDPYEKLRKLAELKDQGILTVEEFEAKKTVLLEGI